MLNQLTMMGRLTRDPELRRTGSGIACANFSIAVDRDYSTKDGGEKETDFFDCVAWRGTGEFVSKYFTKGRMAVVSGRLENRNWTDKDGNKHYKNEIVVDNIYFGDSKKDTPQQPVNDQGGYAPQAPQGGYAPQAPQGGFAPQVPQAPQGYPQQGQQPQQNGYQQQNNYQQGGYSAPGNYNSYGGF